MSQSGLDAFGGYRKARQLFDLVVKDMEVLKTNPLCYRLVSQQIAARIRSVPTSKRVMGGSPGLSTFVSSTSHEALLVRRVRRYERMTNWLDQEVIQQRVELLDEIIGILTTSIETMRKKR
jgi:hypothetical protein